MSNGPIAIEHVADPVSVTVSNGPVAIEDANSSVEASATNGPISYKGAVGGNFKMRSTRGGIVLELPADSRFELDAEADRGHVVCEFDVKDAAAPSETQLPRVFLRSERGEIVVRESSPVGVSYFPRSEKFVNAGKKWWYPRMNSGAYVHAAEFIRQ